MPGNKQSLFSDFESMRLHTLHELDGNEGTVLLRDRKCFFHRDHKKSSLRLVHPEAGTADSSEALVLVPRPSDTDPNDPLRWPTWKKHVAFGSVCAFVFLTNYGIGGLAPAFYILHLEFNKTMAETSRLLLWPVLVLGLFVSQPRSWA